MSRADLMNKSRLEGMYYAYSKIKEIGLDEFAKELTFRSKHGVQLVNTRMDIAKFEREVIDRVQDVVMIFALAVLIDEFDFSAEDIERFQERLALKSACIDEKYITWEEQKQILKDEYGIEVHFKGESRYV